LTISVLISAEGSER